MLAAHPEVPLHRFRPSDALHDVFVLTKEHSSLFAVVETPTAPTGSYSSLSYSCTTSSASMMTFAIEHEIGVGASFHRLTFSFPRLANSLLWFQFAD